MNGQAGNSPQEGKRETFRVFWIDANHPIPVMVLLRFPSKFRAELFAKEIEEASPGVKAWVEKETAAPAADAA